MNQSKDIIQVQGINSQGYGIIPKMVMQDKRLTIQAKAIYGYFCSYAGAGKTAFPGRAKIMSDLKVSKESYYKHFNLLKECGYIKAYQEKDENGSFCRNVYTLVEAIPCPKKQYTDENSPCPKFRDTGFRDTEKQDTNNNSIKINSINNYQSVSQTDGQKGLEVVREVIQSKICYEDLKLTHPDDVELIDEFVAIILDVVLSDGETICISGENKPRELVKSSLMKLTYENIVLVLEQFNKQGKRIQKKKQYLLSMLYNSSLELNAHYRNWVQSDWRNRTDDGRN